MIYRNATEADLAEIAKVHVACFPDYFLSSLGQELLQKYYLEFLTENDLFVVAVDEQSQKIAGFCMGYYKGSRARSDFESKYKFQLARRLCLLCLKFNKTAIKKCFAKVAGIFGRKQQSSGTGFKPDSDLLSIGVLEEYRGKAHGGVAKNLVEAFHKRIFENAGDREIKNCTLSVFDNNARARAFYEKMGYEVLSSDGTEVKYIKHFN